MSMHPLQKKILGWYREHKRDLPWRHTTDPYKILVSEVMLQQTQVDRVIPYYERWLAKWPNVHALARASTPELLSQWSGLGYNNRALRLRELARVVSKEHDGVIPSTEDELRALPGIGPYTAHAIMAFAYNLDVPVMDTNIRRVLIHELALDEDIGLKELSKIALDLVPKGRSCEWHNALMDYGAMVQTARKTGIKPLSKQSDFKGSDREVRGWIIKQLVAGLKLTPKDVQHKFSDKDTSKIINKMEQDGLLKADKHLKLN